MMVSPQKLLRDGQLDDDEGETADRMLPLPRKLQIWDSNDAIKPDSVVSYLPVETDDGDLVAIEGATVAAASKASRKGPSSDSSAGDRIIRAFAYFLFFSIGFAVFVVAQEYWHRFSAACRGERPFPPSLDDRVSVYVVGSSESVLWFRNGWREQILREALDDSTGLYLTEYPHKEDGVWLVDLEHLLKLDDDEGPERLLELVQTSKEKRMRMGRTGEWKIFLVDWSDTGKVVEEKFRPEHFEALAKLAGSENVHFAQRAGVVGREVPQAKGSRELAAPAPNKKHDARDGHGQKDRHDEKHDKKHDKKHGSSYSLDGGSADPFAGMKWGIKKTYEEIAPYVHGGCPGHLDYTVRTDLLDVMEGLLSVRLASSAGRRQRQNATKVQHPKSEPPRKRTDDEDSSADDPFVFGIDRPKDAVHFWNPTNPDGATRVALRNAVSSKLNSMDRDHPDLSFLGGEIGSRSVAGRNFPQEDYAAAMLEYKIVVVCQRDTYEGHFRLMESLSSGAMVMTDYTHYLPDGIKDGEGIVVYKDLTDMEDKILYYLKNEEERKRIARVGRDAALNGHRSWHWLERFLLEEWPQCPGA